jgi:hypothetical protein
MTEEKYPTKYRIIVDEEVNCDYYPICHYNDKDVEYPHCQDCDLRKEKNN